MSITKSQTDAIGSIFNGNRFIIPTYQRKYSWTDNERRALWQDIEESLASDMHHFVGTLSFKENKNNGVQAILDTDTVYEVIDGQQRITTIFILLSVLIDKLDNQTAKEKQLGALIGAPDALKLQPLGKDGSFLNSLIFEFNSVDISKNNKRSQKFMYAAKMQFMALAHHLTPTQAAQRIIFIKDKINVLVFNVENQAQAVKMFSIINDRGLPLRILDKTKSILMLYSTLHLQEKLNHRINDGFEKIFDSYDSLLIQREKLKILGRLEENTIFTHHYYSSERLFPETWNNRNGAETVFENLKLKCEQLKNKENELEQFIVAYLDDFTNFSLAYAALVQDIETVDEYRKPFQFLEFTATLYPLLVRLHMQNKLADLLPLLETTEVRVYKLKNTNPIADMYWLSSEVPKGKVTSEEITTHLVNFNEKFMSDHNLKNYLDADVYQNGAVKYILAEYTKDNLSIELYKGLQVEHIFSREPDFDVNVYGFSEDYDYEKNRIGNLGLLEEGLNKGVSNKAPVNKVSGYLTSHVSDMRNLGGAIQAGPFDKSSVDTRREDLIKFCLNRFKTR